MRLWLVRHAPVLLPPGLCYGASDVPADRALTEDCAQRLAAVVPPATPVWCSPLGRCRTLAAALQARRPELAPAVDPRLAEMDFGAWEGQPWDAVGRPALGVWMDDFLHHCPGGGESVAVFMERVRQALRECLAMRHDQGLWITHAGVIKAVRALATRVAPVARAQDWPVDSVACGEWTVLDLPTGGSAAAAPAWPAAGHPALAPAPPGAAPPT